MWLLILEMLLALGVIVFIMVWTMRARIDKPLEKKSDSAGIGKDQHDRPDPPGQ